MKTLFSFLVLFVFVATVANTSFTQKVYSTQYSSDAQVKVYVTSYSSDADLVVYKCKYSSDASGNDVKWYFTEYSSDAGWKNQSKKQLMY